ncbi:MAG TPA: hypothetical protein VHZ74_04190 [Bryobacteraceae bacterium]|nr:hypothetical protein [Bryobacteraceae bacterium]
MSGSLIGKLPARTREVGPLSAVSYRVASRIANTLRAGFPVRQAEELASARCILFHSPPDFADPLLETLEGAAIDWRGRALVFCDCFVDRAVRQRFREKGATTAVARQFGIAGRMIVEADAAGGAALRVAHRIARELHLKAVEVSPGAPDLFDAAITLGSASITPLIDRAAALLRASGVKDIEAARLASALFEQTARDYAHSGKQSWAWYVRKPVVERLQAQIEAAGPFLDPVFRQLLTFAFQTFSKHEDVGGEL